MTLGRALLYASTVGAIGLGARSAIRGPVPAPVVAGAFLGFSTVVMAGVLEPRLGMFADVVNEGDEHPTAPRVALTFDDGPSEKTTPRVLDLLGEAGVRATFFVIGRKLVGEGAAIARRAVAEGHAVACHSFAHDRLFALRGPERVRDDLVRALATIEDVTGARTTLFRPPIGHTNPTIARVADELGLVLVGFSVRAYDGRAGALPEVVVGRVVRGLDDGAIVLLHDASEREDFTPVAPEILPGILAAMRERGLAGVTVDALLDPPRAALPVG